MEMDNSAQRQKVFVSLKDVLRLQAIYRQRYAKAVPEGNDNFVKGEVYGLEEAIGLLNLPIERP